MVLSFLPEDSWSYIGGIVGNLFYFLLKGMRLKIEKNLFCIKGSFGKEEVKAIFINFFTSIIFYTGIRTWGLKKLKRKVFFKIEKGFEEIFYKGAIILSGHIGNPDIGSILFSMEGISGYEIVEDIGFVSKKILRSYRERAFIKTIPTSELKKIFKLKDKRAILYMLIDRDVTGKGVYKKFFRCRRKLPTGYIKIIEKLKKPFFMASCILRKEGFYFIEIKRIEKKEEINSILEETIRKNLTYWFAFDSLWQIEKFCNKRKEKENRETFKKKREKDGI